MDKELIVISLAIIIFFGMVFGLCIYSEHTHNLNTLNCYSLLPRLSGAELLNLCGKIK